MRCTFIHSPDMAYAVTQNYGAKFMPIWALTLASHIDQDLEGCIEMDLFDAQLDNIQEVKPADVFLFSGFNQDEASILKSLKSRKRLSQKKWKIHFSNARGTLTVDDGARDALSTRGSSLLAAGV
ncbi:MAG: hypothetical protein ACE5FU_14640, partial [Nitrospinota bacterium]